jgi:hypothetical protein
VYAVNLLDNDIDDFKHEYQLTVMFVVDEIDRRKTMTFVVIRVQTIDDELASK